MSNREKCIDIINTLDENQLIHILAILEEAHKNIDEIEDENYCERLYKEYLNSKDNGEKISIQELTKLIEITPCE